MTYFERDESILEEKKIYAKFMHKSSQKNKQTKCTNWRGLHFRLGCFKTTFSVPVWNINDKNVFLLTNASPRPNKLRSLSRRAQSYLSSWPAAKYKGNHHFLLTLFIASKQHARNTQQISCKKFLTSKGSLLFLPTYQNKFLRMKKK